MAVVPWRCSSRPSMPASWKARDSKVFFTTVYSHASLTQLLAQLGVFLHRDAFVIHQDTRIGVLKAPRPAGQPAVSSVLRFSRWAIRFTSGCESKIKNAFPGNTSERRRKQHRETARQHRAGACAPVSHTACLSSAGRTKPFTNLLSLDGQLIYYSKGNRTLSSPKLPQLR